MMTRSILIVIALLFAIAMGNSVSDTSEAIISLEPDQTYQTMVGWEAVAQAGQWECDGFAQYADQVFDQAADDLGINRLRLEVKSGVENNQDNWSEYQAGQIDHSTWRSVRYSTVNDNADPADINWNGYHFSELDHTVDTVVLPLKRRVEANGEELFINLNYVAFTAQIGAGLPYHHDDPEEYAEFVLATYLHLQNKYGWVPDAWEIILEPDNVAQWNGTLIGQAMVATAQRLQANGFTPAFIAPSNTSMAGAIGYFDDMMKVQGAGQYLEEFSYHRYTGVSDANLTDIAQRAQQYGINTAMLEHIGSGYEDLHQDLKLGRNSAWQQFTLAWCSADDDGGAYYRVDLDDPAGPKVYMGNRTKFLRQYFRFVRRGAVRIEATTSNDSYDPLAFINTDGRYVVVIKANTGGEFSINGLPPGTYGAKYTTAAEYDADLADVTLEQGQTLRAAIPVRGVITVYSIPRPTATATPSATVTPETTVCTTPSPAAENSLILLPVILKQWDVDMSRTRAQVWASDETRYGTRQASFLTGRRRLRCAPTQD